MLVCRIRQWPDKQDVSPAQHNRPWHPVCQLSQRQLVECQVSSAGLVRQACCTPREMPTLQRSKSGACWQTPRPGEQPTPVDGRNWHILIVLIMPKLCWVAASCGTRASFVAQLLFTASTALVANESKLKTTPTVRSILQLAFNDGGWQEVYA